MKNLFALVVASATLLCTSNLVQAQIPTYQFGGTVTTGNKSVDVEYGWQCGLSCPPCIPICYPTDNEKVLRESLGLKDKSYHLMGANLGTWIEVYRDGGNTVYDDGEVRVEITRSTRDAYLKIKKSPDKVEYEAHAFAKVPKGPGHLNFRITITGRRPFTAEYWRAQISNGTSFQPGTWMKSSPQTPVAVMDFDGDGKADLLTQYRGNDNRYHFAVHRSTGTSFESDGPAREWTSTDNEGFKLFFADVNGDHRPDFIMQLDYKGQSLWDVRLNNGYSFVRVAGTIALTLETPIAVIDFDGDGKADLITKSKQDGRTHFVVHRSTGTTFEGDGPASEWTSTDNEGFKLFFADVNGDHLTDFIMQLDYGGKSLWDVRINTGYSFMRVSGTIVLNPETPLAVMDFDGDGMADLLSQYRGPDGRDHFAVHRSTGTTFEGDGPASEWTRTDNIGFKLFFADVNGDRHPDFIMQLDNKGQSQWDPRLNTGSSFVRFGEHAFSNEQETVITMADINGDGKADLITVK